MLLWGLGKQEVWQVAAELESRSDINTLKLRQDEPLGPPVQGDGPDYWKTVISYCQMAVRWCWENLELEGECCEIEQEKKWSLQKRASRLSRFW